MKLFLTNLLIPLIFFGAIAQDSTKSFLSDNDLDEIADRANKLFEKTGFSFSVSYAEEVYLNPNQAAIVLLLDPTNRIGTIRTNLKGRVVNQAYCDRLIYLYIKQGYESNNLKNAILWMIADIEKGSEDQIILKVPVQPAEDPGSDPEFLIVLWFFILIGIVYVVKTLHKVSRKTNKAEYWQYYGYSRLTVVPQTVIAVMLIGLIAVFIFQYVYYYEDIVTLYFVLLIVARPIVLFGGYAVKQFEDSRFIKKLKIEKPTFLSLGQKMFLMKPDLMTEEYLLLDIYELLIRKDLVITAELKDPSRPNHYRNFISGNDKPTLSKCSSFQAKVLTLFPKDQEKYFLVPKLIDEIMILAVNYKVYKKDYLALDLVRQGFLETKGWVKNKFVRTAPGEEYAKKISNLTKQLRFAVEEYLHGSGEPPMDKLKGEVMLLSQAEKKIDDLYNRLLNDLKLDEARESDIGVLLEPSFSFAAYRSAIKKQILESYESRGSRWLDE